MPEHRKKNPAAAQAAEDTPDAQVETDNEEEHNEVVEGEAAAAGGAAKKKKSKRKRVKDALKGKAGKAGEESESKENVSKAVSGLSKEQIQELMKMNPALAQEMAGERDLGQAMKKLNLEDIMTGLAANGKNYKDIGSYKFWQTQPVPKFGDKEQIEEGPFKIVDIDKVPKEPGPMVEGFEWVTMDLTDEGEIKEVYELLNGHYVEDAEAMFRFNYSPDFFQWYDAAPAVWEFILTV